MRDSTVIIRKASYEYQILRPLIFEIVDSFCGDRVRSGSRVLIKPNLLAPARPDRAIVTHPCTDLDKINHRKKNPKSLPNEMSSFCTLH